MALSATGLNAAANGIKASATYVSLHSGDPGTTGANEITGGSPAYARKSATWGTPSNGSVSLSSSVQFDIPSGVNVSHFGTWNAATSGSFVGGEVLRDSNNVAVVETYSAQGLYTLTSATLTVTNPS